MSLRHLVCTLLALLSGCGVGAETLPTETTEQFSQLSAALFVDCRTNGVGADGSAARPFNTLQTAIDRLLTTGGRIEVTAGVCQGPITIRGVKAPLWINGAGSGLSQVSGAKKLTGWTRVGATNTYRAPSTEPVTQVFFKSLFLKRARYPVSGFLKVGADAPKNLPSAQNLTLPVAPTDLAALKNRDLKNAVVTARIVDYWYNSVVVSGLNPDTGVLAVAAAPPNVWDFMPANFFLYPPAKDWGYFLENKAWMVTPGTWAYEPLEKYVYVSLPDGSDPATASTLEVANHSTLLTIESSPLVTLTNLRVWKSGADGLRVVNSPGLTLDRVNVSNTSEVGVRIYGTSTSWKVTNSTIENTGSSGFDASHSAASTTGVLLDNNDFRNIGTPLGPRWTPFGVGIDCVPPSSTATPNTLRNNRLLNIAYVGMLANYGTTIENNSVERFCSLADDCGGIYVTGRWTYSGATIRNNIVRHGLEYVTGKGRGAYPVAGIYLDDHARNIVVEGNVVDDVPIGLMLHNAHTNRLHRNVIVNTSIAVRSQEDDVKRTFSGSVGTPVLVGDHTQPSTYSNIFTANIIGVRPLGTLVNVSSNQTPTVSRADRLDRALGGFRGRGNTFLNQTDSVYLTYNDSFGGVEYSFRDLTSNGFDAAPFKPFDNTRSIYKTTAEIATLHADTNATLAKFTLWSSAGTATLAQVSCPVPSSSGLCLKLSSATSGDTAFISPTFPITNGNDYRVRLQLRSTTASDVLASVIPRRNGPTYEGVDSLKAIGRVLATSASGSWSVHELYFRANTDLPNARIDLQIPSASEIVLGGFEVKSVNLARTDFSEFLQTPINASPKATQVACVFNTPELCGGWRDLEGFEALFPLNLQPRSALVLWRDPAQSISTPEPDLGMVSRVELESVPLKILRDVKANGVIGPAGLGWASGDRALAALDNGDEFSFPVTVPRAGVFHFAVRVRTGYKNATTADPFSYLVKPDDYQLAVDGTPMRLVADLDGVTGPDPSGGGVYWGNLYTSNFALAGGVHTVTMKLNSNWQFIDVLEVLSSDVPMPVNTRLVSSTP